MAQPSERMRVLQMIEDGQVSAAEGLRRLDALAADAAAPAPLDTADTSAASDITYWRRWWIIPLGGGLCVLAVGGLLMAVTFQAGGLGFWFACATLPAILGALTVILAIGSRSARWLHVRVRANPETGEWPRNIAISFPLPIRLTAWLVGHVGRYIPSLHKHGLDQLIPALAESITADTPLYLDVDEGNGGERVQVYIG